MEGCRLLLYVCMGADILVGRCDIGTGTNIILLRVISYYERIE